MTSLDLILNEKFWHDFKRAFHRILLKYCKVPPDWCSGLIYGKSLEEIIAAKEGSTSNEIQEFNTFSSMYLPSNVLHPLFNKNKKRCHCLGVHCVWSPDQTLNERMNGGEKTFKQNFSLPLNIFTFTFCIKWLQNGIKVDQNHMNQHEFNE